MTKTHKTVRGTFTDPNAYRSLCGRSSDLVIRVDTIEFGQNLDHTGGEVTCKFCLRMIEVQARKSA
jgi:hypothetical protein